MPDVTVYTSPTCHYCHLAKEWLSERNIAFVEKDVTHTENALEVMEKTDMMGTPVIVVGDEIILGFDQSRLAELLVKK